MIDHTGPALTSPDHHAWLRLQARGLLDFARKTMVAGRGAGWLTVDGQVDDTQAIHTWITARMVHAFSLVAILGDAHAREIAQEGLDALRSG